MSQSMIERVAKVLAKQEYGDRIEEVWHNYADHARAIIRSIREPTISMEVAASKVRVNVSAGGAVEVGTVYPDDGDQKGCGEIWRTMIDDALAEEPPHDRA